MVKQNKKVSVKNDSKEHINAIIYARTATTDQSKDKLDEQIKVCKKYAKSKGYKINDCLIHKEICSGIQTYKKSLGLLGILNFMRGFSEHKFVLIVSDVSRISRSLENLNGYLKALKIIGLSVEYASVSESNKIKNIFYGKNKQC